MNGQYLHRVTRARRDLACRVAALMIAAILAERLTASSCGAQLAAAESPTPGLVLLAGDAGDRACAGTVSLRPHLPF